MIERINVIKIIKLHLKTLRSINSNSSNIYWGDALLFFVIPLVLSIGLVCLNVNLNDLVGDLIKAFAIFSAFLFNMLAIIYNSMKDLKLDAMNSQIKSIYIKEIHSNLSFNILVGLFLVVFLIIQKIIGTGEGIHQFCFSLVSGLNFYLILLFFLTLLMNLNRVFILLNKEIEKEKRDNK